jgi:Tol biopolymer transport system component
MARVDAERLLPPRAERGVPMRYALLRTSLAITASAVLAVTAFAAPAGAKVSGPNGQIVFARFSPALGDTVAYIVNPDGTGLERLSPGNFGIAESPHWSPDGSNVAFISQAGRTCCTVAAAIANPDTGTFRLLPMQDPATLFTDCHIWAPDAARLACVGLGVTDPSLTGIYTIRSSDGGGLTRMTSNPGGEEDNPCDYSPDGTHLVFIRTTADGSQALYTVNVDGTGLTQIAPLSTSLTDFQCGSWSPQCNQILFAARAAAGQRRSIWEMNSDGSGLRQVPITPACGGAVSDPTSRSCQDPGWSPDGTKIVLDIFVSATGKRSIYTVNADGSGLSQVTHSGTAVQDEGPDWGPHPLTP